MLTLTSKNKIYVISENTGNFCFIGSADKVQCFSSIITFNITFLFVDNYLTIINNDE